MERHFYSGVGKLVGASFGMIVGARVNEIDNVVCGEYEFGSRREHEWKCEGYPR